MKQYFSSFLSYVFFSTLITCALHAQELEENTLLNNSWVKAKSLSSNSRANDNVYVYTDSLSNQYIKGKRGLIIALPNSYFENPAKHYPVIYMMDGQNLFDAETSYAGEWNADSTLLASGSQLIIVGIDNGSAQRINDYTPREHNEYGGGNGKNFLKFIIETVKPLIDTQLRTIPDRNHTYIGGSSLGGLISIYALMNFEETFSKGIIFSPSFWFDDLIMGELKEWNPKHKISLYLLVGGKEGESMVPDTELAYSILKTKKKIRSKQITDINGEHNERFWSKYLSYAIEFIKY
ncbi:alpha/beta hydrolase [Marinigracilibium pacificum]|uniref:Alpha/beta hydrolase n=1 Tax=Marinigracilibium pacificum TaxID=2729599 RepID=A0A848IUR4_9BACT|nr:alpha/beta hydrolase-fold protein [Marinigracilibium pacificum]NMM48077.1 alpha/beta hydrolase [Marinigracilibium pacificum]